MQFWQNLIKNPSGQQSMDDFAFVIDRIPKIVFSNTLKNTDWQTATLAKRKLEDEITQLKKQSGKDILIGSRSLIIQLLNLNLIDEFQICIHPIIEGKGLQLFDEINNKINFQLLNTKIFKSGVIVHYYKPIYKN